MPDLEAIRWYRDQLFQRAKMLRGPLAILMYHRVCPRADHAFLQDAGVPWISPEVFREHLQYLKREGFRVLRGEEVLARLARGERLPPRSAWITFDDGFRDNLIHAARALHEEGLSASFFIASGMLDREELLFEHKLFAALAHLGEARTRELLGAFVPPELTARDAWLHHLNYRLPHERRLELDRVLCDELAGAGIDQRTLASELYMDENDLGSLAALDQEIGSHGTGHFHLGTMNAEDRARDLRGAHERLEGIAKRALLPVFSSPYGGHGARDVPFLRDMGYRAALSARFGTNARRTSPFFLRRIALGESSWHRLRFLRKSSRWARRMDAVF